MTEAELSKEVEDCLDENWTVFWGNIEAKLRATVPKTEEEQIQQLQKWVYAGYLEGFGAGGLCSLDSIRKKQNAEAGK